MKTFNASKIVCPDCGEVDHALVNGYAFGDRLLEGVMFKITISQRGIVMAESADDDSREYLKDLSANKWTREAVRYAIGCDSLECPTCHEAGAEIQSAGQEPELGNPQGIQSMTARRL
jgi:hypothetical protein